MNLRELRDFIDRDSDLKSLLGIVEKNRGEDAAHDTGHLLRVALWATRFAEGRLPMRSLVAAALLHDLVNIPKNSANRGRASELSAEKAGLLMQSRGFRSEEVLMIQAAIRDHSFSRGSKPENFLGECLQDADRLEALGAIGLMRVFSTGAKFGARYFHPDDPWAKDRELEEKEFSVDHFFTKLLRLEEKMNTKAGREEAARRTQVLKEFLLNLGEEIGVPCAF